VLCVFVFVCLRVFKIATVKAWDRLIMCFFGVCAVNSKICVLLWKKRNVECFRDKFVCVIPSSVLVKWRFSIQLYFFVA